MTSGAPPSHLDLSTDGDWLDVVAPDTEMGRRVAGFDWASTSLGPPSEWSASLRGAVTTCLTSGFPVLVVWGPELIKIYNDGYRPMLGAAKHPRALGAPTSEVWAEIWDTIGPMFDEALAGGTTLAERQLLVVERNGFAEHAWFTWSYSPLYDDDGSIAGVIDISVEVTDEVLARRRLQCLTELSRALYGASHIAELCATAAATLSRASDDLSAIDLHLVYEQQVSLAASTRRGESPIHEQVLEEVARDGQGIVIGRSPMGPAERVVLPIGGPSGEPVAILSASLDPHLAYDEAYEEFVALVGATLSSAIDNAYRHSTELGEYRKISETLQGAMLSPVSDLPTVAARYLAAEGKLAVGGDWYDVIELPDGRRGLVVGDCVGHGLQAAAAMSQLRSAARAMLLEGRSPAEVLAGLDPLAESLPDAYCATAVCAVVNRGEHEACYARAGHLPPLVVGDDGITWLEDAAGPPLGLGGGSRDERDVQLRAGDRLIMFSDGLVERRREHIDEGLQRLARTAVELHERPVQEIADELIAAMVSGHQTDDVVLVVKQL